MFFASGSFACPAIWPAAAKSAGRLTFRPSGNSTKRELMRPPRPSITKRVPTGNRSGKPTLLPLTRLSFTTQRVQTCSLNELPIRGEKMLGIKVAVYHCGRQPGLVRSYRLRHWGNSTGVVCLSSRFLILAFNYAYRITGGVHLIGD